LQCGAYLPVRSLCSSADDVPLALALANESLDWYRCLITSWPWVSIKVDTCLVSVIMYTHEKSQFAVAQNSR